MIHKQNIGRAVSNVVRLPAGAVILSAGSQANTLVIWYQFQETNGHPVGIDVYEVLVITTGGIPIDTAGACFINTVQQENDLVYHLFFRMVSPSHASVSGETAAKL